MYEAIKRLPAPDFAPPQTSVISATAGSGNGSRNNQVDMRWTLTGFDRQSSDTGKITPKYSKSPRKPGDFH
jgi:hypothetical protein